MTEVKNNSTENKFELFQDGKKAGEIVYSKDDSNLTITHTEVDEEYEGQGLGQKLVEAGVNFAKENNLKIVPLCSYAKRTIEKNADWHSVVA